MCFRVHRNQSVKLHQTQCGYDTVIVVQNFGSDIIIVCMGEEGAERATPPFNQVFEINYKNTYTNTGNPVYMSTTC